MNIHNINNNSLIVYPCNFPLKIIGKNCEQFKKEIYSIIKNYDPKFDLSNIDFQLSKSAKYIGLTVTIFATSRTQLDNIYKDLCANSLVSFVL
ncbi:hypothetical protein CKSOR_00653 [Candidatus Kinetoplastibacterium sorsogonicusi]|uniref:Uncharacterized protein n=1 Tax=Candidatus Kinetoplastidibacterium kentomonadis TaxID=1576550 RepID=A0A3S7JAR7_9PROT|nr:DUF493 domain-containing protein [Candidatus Kinetoplastibacterium sorsogonicusi]AWD32754.1 hypothetical protein CKSOR_00653 [Candidatus Kinetoplastibacterium sorsogonicusi]